MPEYREDQREFFDRLITQDWDSYHDPWWEEVRRRETEAVFRRIAPERVLDIGCGCGFHDVLMADQPGVRAVVGIDYSTQSIATAQREYPHPKVTREVGDVLSWQGAEERPFDLAISFQVIEHLTDAAAFLAACRRHVRPGGWVVALTPNRQRLNNLVRRAIGLKPGLEDPQHFREYTRRELAQIGADVGLRDIGVVSYGWSLTIPGTGQSVIGRRLGYRVGELLPATADRIGTMFRVETP